MLLAMGIEESVASGAVRVSLGMGNTEGDIERVLAILRELASGTLGAIPNLGAMQRLHEWLI